MYVPAATLHCPTAGWVKDHDTPSNQTDCALPQWPSNDTYPHPTWKSAGFPFVKTVDLFFRVSASIDWDHICYDYIRCSPRILWREKISSTKEDDSIDMVWRNVSFVDKSDDQFNMMCYAKPPLPPQIFGEKDTKNNSRSDGFVYIHLPADECFPWCVLNDQGQWRSTKLENPISLIKQV